MKRRSNQLDLRASIMLDYTKFSTLLLEMVQLTIESISPEYFAEFLCLAVSRVEIIFNRRLIFSLHTLIELPSSGEKKS